MAVKELFQGINSYFKAVIIISRYKLWKYLILPGILSILYIIVLISLGVSYIPDISAYFTANYLPEFLQRGFMQVVIVFILWLFFLIVIFITYKEFILIFFSPVLSYLSEKIEKVTFNHEPPPFTVKSFFYEIFRGIVFSLRNLVFMLLFTLISWLLIFIPVIGTVISPLLILLVQSYYAGIGLSDITLERKKFPVKESITFGKENRAEMTGLGLGFIIILMLPVIGWFFAPGLGTVAATLTAMEIIEKKNNF
ncbi:MAG: EI24 domain-containing protein [Spirochaetes bacterium]|nr:EI24 domain-containing protein [Spirochaetota bacterium]